MTLNEILTKQRNAMRHGDRNDVQNQISCLQITVCEILNEFIGRDLREVQTGGFTEADVRKRIQETLLGLSVVPEKKTAAEISQELSDLPDIDMGDA